MLTSIAVPPAAEPVSLADLKAHLRILHSSEDDLIAACGRVARSHIEETTGRAIADRTIDTWLPGWPASAAVELRPAPLKSVTAVYYLDTGGDEQTLDPSLYDVFTEPLIGQIVFATSGLPAHAVSARAVRIRSVAGYGDAPPDALLHAVKLLTEHLYYRRSPTSDTRVEAVPMSVDALCGPYRTFGWI